MVVLADRPDPQVRSRDKSGQGLEVVRYQTTSAGQCGVGGVGGVGSRRGVEIGHRWQSGRRKWVESLRA